MFKNDKNQFGFFFLGHFTSFAAALPKACLLSLSLGLNKELHFTKFIEILTCKLEFGCNMIIHTKQCVMLCLFILQWWLTVFNIFGIKICYDFPFKGISSGAQFVTPKICLWQPSFGCSQIFPKIPIKLTLKIGGRVLIATHLDQSNYLANQQQV
jgi:hypothetical protein